MTFDEFFKKKRIDLTALQKVEPALFSEFKTHFEQMGEKSFDHTKKYWFNKTRRQFPLSPEIKIEKPHIANPIAEQTITESLSETVRQPTAKVGFTPRFKAGIAKPAVEEKPASANEAEESIDQSESTAAAKPAGFVPKFKMKPKADTEPSLPVPEEPAKVTPEMQSMSPAEATSKPAGFTPRFKMKPKVGEGQGKAETPAIPDISVTSEPDKTAEAQAESASASSKPAGFTPRFKMKPQAESEQPTGDSPVEPAGALKSESESTTENTASETPVKKTAYKPRFVPPKPKENRD